MQMINIRNCSFRTDGYAERVVNRITCGKQIIEIVSIFHTKPLGSYDINDKMVVHRFKNASPNEAMTVSSRLWQNGDLFRHAAQVFPDARSSRI